jgi:phosphatidyl-myo-inositol alpha-mannosyltransferase
VSGRRVALLNGWYWPEVRRGSERFVHDLATDLLALGHRPRLITSHPGPSSAAVEDGFEIVRNRRPPEPWTKRNVEAALSHVPLSYRSLRRGDDDIAHATYFTDALAAVRWRERTGRPALYSYMGIPQRNVVSNKRLRMRILERVTTGVDSVVVLTRAARDGMWRWLGVEAEIISPGIDLDLFTPGEGRAEEPTLASVCDVTDGRKRVDLLVRAFARVRRELPRARLVLIAPSDPVAARGFAADGVELVAPDSFEVARVYGEAWATGLASYNEAFGLVLVESLASGTPVFAARDGGPAEIVDRPGIGRLFEGDDERDVAKAMLGALELAGDPATATACRRRAEDFASLTTARAYVDLYERLLS